MKIAIYGASGTVGSRIAAEALARGHDVTGITRSGVGGPEGVTAEQGDLVDAAGVRAVAERHDVVVSATGPSRTGGPHADWIASLTTLIENAGSTRVIVVGGAGSLLIDDNGTRLVDAPDFPEVYKPEALTQAEALELFRSAPESVDWTYVSPAPLLQPGERTGHYALGRDHPVGGEISAEDFSVAILDEIEQPSHRRTRFTAAAA
jgi:putative NADH-flavin reductase